MYLPIPNFLLDEICRFWSKIDRKGLDECWYFGNNLINRPQINIRKTLYLASRISYFLHYNIDLGDKEVCHSCDCKCCINPYHLFLGTHIENMHDALNKGRLIPTKRWSRILTKEDVINIRKEYKYYKDRFWLANKYNITPNYVYAIAMRHTYKDIQQPRL